MAARCLSAATLVGLALGGCSNVLPRPDYVDVKTPASFRTEPGGVRVDNASYKLDAEGYRVDPQGERVGMIDVPAKTEGDNSNAVAGYYISSTGQVAPSRSPRRGRSRPRSPRPRPTRRRRPVKKTRAIAKSAEGRRPLSPRAQRG